MFLTNAFVELGYYFGYFDPCFRDSKFNRQLGSGVFT